MKHNPQADVLHTLCYSMLVPVSTGIFLTLSTYDVGIAGLLHICLADGYELISIAAT